MLGKLGVGRLIWGLVKKVILPVVKQAAREAAEEALSGAIKKRIGPEGKVLTDVVNKLGSN